MALRSLDLMIGDWLYYKGQFNAFPFKVESITKKKVGYYAEPNDHRIYYLRLSECKPIPLTPEILEKNGFVKESRENHGNNLQYCILTDGLWIDISGENFFEGKLEYVHQLQHALRLCEIEKEIVL